MYNDDEIRQVLMRLCTESDVAELVARDEVCQSQQYLLIYPQ